MRLVPTFTLAAALLIGPAAASAAGKPALKLDYLEAPAAPKRRANPADIEKASGGRMGIAVVDAKGTLLLGFNRDERYAMCSTFKAPLAAAILLAAEQKRFGLDGMLPVRDEDLLDHAPAVRANLKRGRMSIGDLAKAAVDVSDNSAANILLPIVGGPQGLTAFARAHGDTVTRLDRTEPTLNENAQGDERDTTSPAAMATLMARLLFQDMPAPAATQLRGWMEGSTTGARRIRAGMPKGWTVGSKTGSCGNAYNDVAVIRSPRGRDYVLAVYLDRPTVKGPEAEAAIAAAASAAAAMLTALEPRLTP